MYEPDKWMLIHIKGTDPHYRIFGSWTGSYLDGESWRLNSGIENVTKEGNYYIFAGFSGSLYKCHKDMYGASVYGYSVAQHLANESGNTMYLMDEPKNILNMEW